MITLQKKFYKWNSRNVVKYYYQAKTKAVNVKIEWINNDYILTILFLFFSVKINITDFINSMKK